MRKLLISLLVFSILGSSCTGEMNSDREMSLLAVNVRKADALLLRSGNSAYLIDTGTKKALILCWMSCAGRALPD